MPSPDERAAMLDFVRAGGLRPGSATLKGPTGPEHEIGEPPPPPRYAVPDLTRPEGLREMAEILATTLVPMLVAPEISLPAKGVGLGARLLRGAPMIAKKSAASALAGMAASEAATRVFGIEDDSPEARLALAGIQGALGETIGETGFIVAKPALQAATRGLSRIPGVGRITGGLARNKIEPGTEEALDVLNPAGETITAGQAIRSAVLDGAENIASSAFAGAGIFIRSKEGASKAVTQSLDEFVETLGKAADREATGALAASVTQQARDIAKKVAQTSYRRVDRLMKGQSVDIRPLKEMAERISERESKVVGGAGKIRRFVTDLAERSDFVSYEEAQIIRSSLLDLGEAFAERATGRVANRTQAAGRMLARQADQAIEQAFRAAPESIRETAELEFRRANAIWRDEVRGTITNKIIARMARASPDVVLDQLLKARHPYQIRSVRELMEKAQPGSWKNVQAEFAWDLLSKKSDAFTGEVSGASVLNELKRFGGPDGAAVREIFPGPERTAFEDLARTLALVQSEPGKKLGGSQWIKIMQSAAFSGILFTGLGTEDLPAIAVITLGPMALGKAVTNPSIVRILTTGLKEPPGSRTSARLFGRFVSKLTEEGIPFEITNEMPRETLTPEQRSDEEAIGLGEVTSGIGMQ